MVQRREEDGARVLLLDVVQAAQRDDGHAGFHEVGGEGDRWARGVARDGAAGVVDAVGGFGGEGPGGPVAFLER